MKKLYSLLTLIVCLLCSVGAKAADAPLLSTSTKTYPYKVRICCTDNYYISVVNTEADKTNAQLYYTETNSEYDVLTFVFRASSTNTGMFNMYAIVNNEEIPVCLSGDNVVLDSDGTAADLYINKVTGSDYEGYRILTTSNKIFYENGKNNNVYTLGNKSDNSTGKWRCWAFDYAGSTNLTSDEVTLGNTEYTNMATARTTPALWNYATAVEAAQTAGNISESGSALGYPSSTAATTFLSTISEVRSYTTAFDASTFNTAVTTMLESITMPEAGHIYKIQPVFSDGTTYELYWDGTNASRINGDTDDNLASNKSTYFYCGASGNQYFFVNKDGKYLNWSDPGTTGKGYNDVLATDEYNATYNLWTLEPADPINGTVYLGSGSTAAATSSTALAAWVDMLGRFQMKAIGGDGSTTYYLVPRYPADDTDYAMDFVSAYSNNKFYDAPSTKHRTYTFKFEEVTDYFPMVFASKGEGYATYSTPFPVTIPDNVTAYTATAVGSNQVTLKVLSGSYIPEGTGVLVKYTGDLGSGQKIIPVPAAVTNSEAGTVESNQFVATGGDGTTVGASTTAYILGVVSNELGFYTLSSSDRTIAAFRAYLTGTSSTNGLKLNFNDEATGINAAEINAGESAAPVYDLSGRRVTKATRGLYIQGGKKFIAK